MTMGTAMSRVGVRPVRWLILLSACCSCAVILRISSIRVVVDAFQQKSLWSTSPIRCRSCNGDVVIPISSILLSHNQYPVGSSDKLRRLTFTRRHKIDSTRWNMANDDDETTTPNSDDDDDTDEEPAQKKQNKRRKRRSNKQPQPKTVDKDSEEIRLKKKEDLVRAVGETFRQNKQKQMRQEQPQMSSLSDSINQESEKGSGIGSGESLLDRINPFKAGQNLRKTIDQTLSSIAAAQQSTTLDLTQSKYYLDDRFLEPNTRQSSFSTTTDVKSLWEQEDFIPEVLVVGATGEIGRLVVRRLVLTGRCRVRVLVRDLYTKTLNMLGTGVTYCQGDLNNMDSLHYALTDVDKLVFCASPPRPDEEQFQQKFQDYVEENLQFEKISEDLQKLSSSVATHLQHHQTNDNQQHQTNNDDNKEWEQLESVLEVRARLAEQVDCIGMQNLIRAYQDIRHADYGTSQAAKRSLFKFEKDRPGDFNLFSVNTDDDDNEGGNNDKNEDAGLDTKSSSSSEYFGDNYDDDDDDDDEDYYDAYYDDEYASTGGIESRRDASVKTQTQWIRNRFNHGVFVGRIPSPSVTGGVSGEASIISTRLRSRDDPENGIDLGGATGFAGFIVRLCSDGGTYEAFVRTGIYADTGIEYVCEFSTSTKSSSGSNNNKSRNKFTTIRLPFENFKPVRRRQRMSSPSSTFDDDEELVIPPFKGRNVQNIGFRHRAASNEPKTNIETRLLAASTKDVKDRDGWTSFYLALCYIKLYRSQPEPEIVYLSDARIPPVVRNGMVKHEARRLVTSMSDELILDDSTFQQTLVRTKGNDQEVVGRSPEETYYKYRGEEIIRNSGLSYAIVRVTGYNELRTGEASTIDLTAQQPSQVVGSAQNSSEDETYVSRDEIAQVCVHALLDPNALNKSFYVTKKKRQQSFQRTEEDMAAKFAALPTDVIK